MIKSALSSLVLLTLTTSALPQALSPSELTQRRAQGRAVEAVIWGMPAVNTELMRRAASKTVSAGDNQIVFWSRLPSWKNQTLTPNPDAVYLIPFFNTKNGPMVLEIPPATTEGSITGNIDDIWQIALEDAGPSGADKGKGGKYLILPPDYRDQVPDGYIPLRSTNFAGYALLRSIPTGGTDADVAKAVAYGKKVQLYPLAQASNPPRTTFIDAVDAVFDSTIPYDIRFFEALNGVVQEEPWLDRDRVMIDMLKSIGIEKGKAFAPDASLKATLESAANEAKALLSLRLETTFPPYYPGGHWAVPAMPEAVKGQSDGYADRNAYAIDARALTYSIGFVGIKHLGAGQFYLMTTTDRSGQPLDGSATYRLTVPPGVPVSQYWSATAYDRATHAFIREKERFSRSSQNPDLKTNPDGSVHLYFAPTPTAGYEGNWIPTKSSGKFEVLFRLYGPEKPLFEKAWVLPDIEKVP